MDKNINNERNLSTPERKREYVQHWLEENPCCNIRNTHGTDSNEQTPPSSPGTSARYRQFLIPKSPVHGQKNLESCSTPSSPILGKKRTAGSPVVGGRRNLKRLRISKQFHTHTKDAKSSPSSLNSLKNRKRPTNSSEKNEQSSSCKKINSTTITDSNEISNSDSTFCIVVPNEYDNNREGNEHKIDIKNFPIRQVNPESASQLIESLSSQDKSTECTELNVQEIKSDTDKTPSDLIEDISTQLFVESPDKNRLIQFSQNISNPSSESSETTTDVHITESISNSISNKLNTNLQSLEILTLSDPIDSVSTLNSRIDYNKTAYILQYASEKQGKKKNPKKGSLLEALTVSIGKERSNVNLLRHQLYKKSADIIEKPFILLQVLESLPIAYDNQLLKCFVVEDSGGFLKNIMNNRTSQLLTVIIMPEISCTINVNLKPMLKVYEPWTILDCKQLLLHVTRFIAVPAYKKIELNNVSKSPCNKNLAMSNEYYCPCIEKEELSNKCKSKFQDSPYNIVKMIFNDN